VWAAADQVFLHRIALNIDPANLLSGDQRFLECIDRSANRLATLKFDP